MPKVFTSKNQKTGELGESIAVKYLAGKGFTILERNYTKKWGEIDIIAKKDEKVHFIEVKSQTLSVWRSGVETQSSYRPEDNMHSQKARRMARTILTYLAERGVQGEWQVDLVVVWLDNDSRTAQVRILDNIII